MAVPSEYKLSSKQIKKIQAVYETLKEAADAASIPWQMVAAIWFRESFSVTPPKTPGGPFQFDPPPTPNFLRSMLISQTHLAKDKIEALVAKGVNDFEAGAFFCAAFLKLKTHFEIGINPADSVVKDAFYGYNGRAFGNVDKSPYVMNGVDANHIGMRLRGTIPDGNGGRKVIDIKDQRPGAFCVYSQLKELFPNVSI